MRGLLYHIIVKIWTHWKEYQDKRQNRLEQIAVTLKLVRQQYTRLSLLAPTFEIRLKNRIRQTLQWNTVANHDNTSLRAKQVLSSFVAKAGQLMDFKFWTYDFLHGIYKINGQMQDRLQSHRLKMNHLDLLWERELRNMKVSAFNRLPSKKYKKMLLDLQCIEEG